MNTRTVATRRIVEQKYVFRILMSMVHLKWFHCIFVDPTWSLVLYSLCRSIGVYSISKCSLPVYFTKHVRCTELFLLFSDNEYHTKWNVEDLFFTLISMHFVYKPFDRGINDCLNVFLFVSKPGTQMNLIIFFLLCVFEFRVDFLSQLFS